MGINQNTTATPLSAASPQASTSAVVPLSNAEKLPEASRAVQRTSLAIVSLYIALAVVWGVRGLAVGMQSREQGVSNGRQDALVLASTQAWVHCLAFLSVGVGLLILHLIGLGNGKYGVMRPLIGADRRFSTSLATLGLWTLLIVTALAYLLFRSQLVPGTDLDELLPPENWEQYLVLLGGPFAAAILVKGIVTYKLANGTLQKTESSNAELRQVATNDGGGSDIVDTQYLLFNLVAQVYFVVALMRTGRLPVLPEVLLALTSLTAATYVGNKFAARNAPTITSVAPRSITTGSTVTVMGTNFDPNGSIVDGRIVTVTITGLTEPISVPAPNYTDTIVRFTAPNVSGLSSGPSELRVISTAGLETPPAAVDIVP